MNNRSFKLIARRAQGCPQLKKRIYTSLDDFMQYAVKSNPPNDSTIQRYIRYYGYIEVYELIDGLWVDVLVTRTFDHLVKDL